VSPFILSLFNWLEGSCLAESIRQSIWLYPALEIVHIVGIVVLVGAALMFDLRLLGFSKHLPVTGLSRHLLPWSGRGLWLIVPSGILLFSTNAIALSQDFTFWLKMTLLLVAGLNVLIFHRFIYNPQHQQIISGYVPAQAKISALISMVIWLGIITCGRLLAY
jgi:hypothetical protein